MPEVSPVPHACPALANWVFVPASLEAVCLVAPAKMRLVYDGKDFGWYVERMYEQPGALTAHRVSGRCEEREQAIDVLLSVCGLTRRS